MKYYELFPDMKIIEEHCSNTYFWIWPVTIPKEGYFDEPKESFEDSISINNFIFGDFLSYFIYKYYDGNLDANYRYIDDNKFVDKDNNLIIFDNKELNKFRWWFDHNFYNYESIEKMLKEIEEVTILLKEDFRNEKLRKLVDGFSFESDKIYISEGEIFNIEEELASKLINATVEFYLDFVQKMRKLMKKNPQTDLLVMIGAD